MIHIFSNKTVYVNGNIEFYVNGNIAVSNLSKTQRLGGRARSLFLLFHTSKMIKEGKKVTDSFFG
jgi:hypothetical protein